MTAADRLRQQGSAAQAASATLSRLPTETRNHALANIAHALETEQDSVLEGNAADYRDAKADGINDAFLDRLLLTPERLNGMAADVRSVAGLPDPVGELIEDFALENGLDVEKRRVPLGVIASIYESRPNVTTDIASLALKSGNACILRGGKGNAALQFGAGRVDPPRHRRGRAAHRRGAICGQHRPLAG